MQRIKVSYPKGSMQDHPKETKWQPGCVSMKRGGRHKGNIRKVDALSTMGVECPRVYRPNKDCGSRGKVGMSDLKGTLGLPWWLRP